MRCGGSGAANDIKINDFFKMLADFCRTFKAIMNKAVEAKEKECDGNKIGVAVM